MDDNRPTGRKLAILRLRWVKLREAFSDGCKSTKCRNFDYNFFSLSLKCRVNGGIGGRGGGGMLHAVTFLQKVITSQDHNSTFSEV